MPDLIRHPGNPGGTGSRIESGMTATGPGMTATGSAMTGNDTLKRMVRDTELIGLTLQFPSNP
jgi:hypothetical protein